MPEIENNKELKWVLLFISILGIPAALYKLLSDGILAALSLPFVVGIGIYLIYLRKKEPYEFEAISNDITLDIQDVRGELVVYTKRSSLLILRENTLHYTESMSADGDITAFYVSPGVVDDVQKEEGKVLVRTTLGRLVNKKTVVDRVFSAHYIRAFTNDNEYWVQRQLYPTREFCLTVIFPKTRAFKDFQATIRRGAYTVNCKQPEQVILNGRPSLVWRIQNPMLKDDYRLQWAW